MNLDLSNTQLFRGIEPENIQLLLGCLKPITKEYKKGNIILLEGDTINSIGIVLSGMVFIEHNDVWGNKNILGNVAAGSIFGESYACSKDKRLLINVTAAEDSKILFLDISGITGTCSKACLFHQKIIQNLLEICSNKSIQLSKRIIYTSPKSIRGRLMSYFSDCVKQNGCYLFEIPFNRQQLADYLSVDRSTMCNELSKMQKDGLIDYDKNTFKIK